MAWTPPYYVGLALMAVAAANYGLARTAGLSALDAASILSKRSVHRGDGDPLLARALTSDAEGDWD